MLQEIKESQVLGLLFANGATFYGNTTLTDGVYTINKPLAFRQMQQEGGQIVMVPTAFLPSNDPDLTIRVEKHHVILTFPPQEDLVAAYQEVTGAIVTPPTQKLILPS